MGEPPSCEGPGGSRLQAVGWDALPDYDRDAHDEALAAIRASGMTDASLRPARPRSAALQAALAHAPQGATPATARAFFETWFQPWRIVPPQDGRTFLTGYYEPEVDGSLRPSADVTAAILARPDDLVPLPMDHPLRAAGLTAARRDDAGGLHPYPERAAIEQGAIAGHTRPLVWLRDAVEAFLIAVQGSARVRLDDGRLMRLVYDGRNGHPYCSIGRILIEEGAIAAADMSLARLRAWLRADAARGLRIMHRNPSFIFFRAAFDLDPAEGPIGAAGVPLMPLRSIAVDRALWCYGLPFFVAADLPWRGEQLSPFARLLVAHDTGAAIVGPARADLFFGTGEAAGRLAGGIRHAAAMFVLLPKDGAP